MAERLFPGLKNRLLQMAARSAPGATTWRVWLHRWRGVKIGQDDIASDRVQRIVETIAVTRIAGNVKLHCGDAGSASCLHRILSFIFSILGGEQGGGASKPRRELGREQGCNYMLVDRGDLVNFIRRNSLGRADPGESGRRVH